MHIQIQDNSGYKFGIFFGIFEKRSALSEKKPPLVGIVKNILSVLLRILLKMYSEERIPSFHECLPLLGFIMSKKQERLRSELLSEDKITNL